MKVKVLNDCRGLSVDEIREILYEQRRISDPDRFFYPTEKDLLPLDSLCNIKHAADIYMRAIENGSKIGILYDCDLDGICSGEIIYDYTIMFTPEDNVKTFINDGKLHGLKGTNLSRFDECDLVIIVDSLDENAYAYEELSKCGKEIIVLDHHKVNKKIPYHKYVTLVSSQIDYGNPGLSGAGVCWKFVKYIDKIMDTNFSDNLIDLCACGLVGDMMPMDSMENRYLVYKGLNNVINPAVKKIISGRKFNSRCISFSIAPLVNACMRMGENESAMNLFMAKDNKDVLKYKRVATKSKDSQNAEVDSMKNNLYKQCEAQKDNKVIVVKIDTEYGISGLIGNKLLEKYKKPLLIVKEEEEDGVEYYSGSMRAEGVKDFSKIINDSGIAKATGHELAAGFRVEKSKMNSLLEYLEIVLANVTFEERGYVADIQVDIDDVTQELIDMIAEFDYISGTGFAPIKLYIKDVYVYEVGNMSDGKHLVIKYDPDNCPKNKWIIDWNHTAPFDEFEDGAILNDEVRCVCTLDSGFFGRNYVQQMICEAIEVG